MFVRFLVVGILAVGMTGCATNQMMSEVVSSWEGATVAQVKQQWGEPHEIGVDAQNRQVMVWRNDMPEYRETSRVSTTKYNIFKGASHETKSRGYMEVRKTCNRVLVFDQSGRVSRDSSWQGTNCPPFRAADYQAWRRAS